jgi:hypothetical protein
LSLALALAYDFAVVPAHLVGYRRSSTSKSRNENMERALELNSNWVMERWPEIPQKVRQKMMYNRYGYLAHLALTNGQFGKAWRYKIGAYKSLPAGLFTGDSIMFGARFTARMVGISRKSWPVQPKPVSFQEFLAQHP